MSYLSLVLFISRGRLSVPRSTLSSRQHRRPRYPSIDSPFLVHRYVHKFLLIARISQKTNMHPVLHIYILGIFWAIVIPGLNQLFSFRYPSITIAGVCTRHDALCLWFLQSIYHQIVAQLLSFPMGKAWSRFFPNVKILGVSINPGPFSIKEHVEFIFVSTHSFLSSD